MNQLTHYKHKSDFLILSDTSLSQQTQTIVKSKYKKEKCKECNKRRKPLDKSHQICHVCYKTKEIFNVNLSGNNIVDDFIKYSQTNLIKMEGKMEFVPYNQFKNIEFIAEGGFSKIYKATWVNGPINSRGIDRKNISRLSNHTVILKKLNNSKNITSRELNELKVFYDYHAKLETKYSKSIRSKAWHRRINGVISYYGITQDLNSQDFMIIMPYYNKGDLIHYICDDFYNIKWYDKLDQLEKIANGLINMHSAHIIHRDLHSGNIFFDEYECPYIGDLGISKSATESKDNNENYGIIPYMAPEIFQGQKYTVASDIYSFGMIMWEFMTGRRPF
ncbi:hypothetical protein RclHR1_00770006 [Rhizophagus clarus]|uniref:Protein kinase domain-containing protein n=1 Tax=Rhizophagus clarus TaxID=94130 RepID=A0A2Z6S4F2_9GLOM|nr:hypothetical protein RclHR1_00770006 [Rhizophagus clarus]